MRRYLPGTADPKLLRLLQWWEEARRDREMPERADLDPADLVDILPFLVLLDIGEAEDRTPQFTYRLAGGHFEDNLRLSLRGKRVRDLPLWGSDRREVYSQYARTLEQRRPTYCVQEYDTQDGWHVRYECLLTPMSRRGETLDMILGAVSFLTSHRSLPDLGR
ncbi:MAG TPA: PAS domain-containing protein [Alphaproteobacteria bacterium]|nr:PAS domain-containing protein [Alphaproteobacteria bacterium]